MTYIVGGLQLDRPFRIRKIGHFGIHCKDIGTTVNFMTDRLGITPSDWYDATARCPQLRKEDATGWFMRCNGDHHSFVVGSNIMNETLEPQRKGEPVNQLAWQVGSLQEVSDAITYLDKNARLRRVGRDAPGSNYHAYAYDPDGYVNEVFYGIEQVGWEGYSKPKSMYELALREAPVLPCLPEYAEVNDFRDRKFAFEGFHWVDKRELKYVVEGIKMPQPFKLTHLGHMTLFISDLERSLAFYCNVLGLKVTHKLKIDGHECAFLRAEEEHHTLTLCPNALKEKLGLVAAYGLPVATYQQLRDAYTYMKDQGMKILDLPAELSPGVNYGFWVLTPDDMAVQIYYGMDRVGIHGEVRNTSTVAPANWPQSIVHGGSAWHDPIFSGPWA